MKRHFHKAAALFVLIALAQGRVTAAEGKITIGPYVPSVNTNSAVVAFELAAPSTATVTLKTQDGQRVFASDIAQELHFVSMDGLEPGRAYEYSISAPGLDLGPRGQGLFKTASLPGESFSFTVIGDTRPGENRITMHHAALAEQIALVDPAFTVVLGDLVDDGSNPDDWRVFFDVEQSVLRRAALFPVFGDNDYANGKGLMPRYFPPLAEKFYSFEWGGVFFFGLFAWDTKGKQPESEFDEASAQYRWLASELARPAVQEAPFRVVFVHDPVFISRGRASRLLQETFGPLFEQYRVDLVFASWHLYERSRVKRVNYVISGGGGAELIWSPPNPDFKAIVDAKRYHFCRVDVGAGGLTLRAVTQDGTVLDQVSLSTNIGDTTANEERFRFATRMATIDTHGDGQGPAIPVYVFDAGDAAAESNEALDDSSRSLDEAIAVHRLNLRKEGVFDLLLHALEVTGGHAQRLPAVFVGRRHVAGGLDDLLPALEKTAFAPQENIFKQRVNLTRARASAFAKLTPGRVAVSGLERTLTVGGFLWLLGFGGILLWARRRGRSIAVTGSAALGIAFSLCVLWGVFYLDLVKMLPAPDLLATIFGPRDRSLVFFAVNAMIGDPFYRGDGLMYLALHTLASLLPAALSMGAFAFFAKRSRSNKDAADDA